MDSRPSLAIKGTRSTAGLDIDQNKPGTQMEVANNWATGHMVVPVPGQDNWNRTDSRRKGWILDRTILRCL